MSQAEERLEVGKGDGRAVRAGRAEGVLERRKGARERMLAPWSQRPGAKERLGGLG